MVLYLIPILEMVRYKLVFELGYSASSTREACRVVKVGKTLSVYILGNAICKILSPTNPDNMHCFSMDGTILASTSVTIT